MNVEQTANDLTWLNVNVCRMLLFFLSLSVRQGFGLRQVGATVPKAHPLPRQQPAIPAWATALPEEVCLGWWAQACLHVRPVPWCSQG